MTVEVSGVTNLVVRYKLLIVIFAITFIIIDILVHMADIITTGAVIMTTMVVIVKEFLSSSQHGCHQNFVLRQLLSLRNDTVPNFEYSWCWYHQNQILIRNFLRANVDFYQDGTTLFPSYIIWPELPKKVASQESNCCQIWSKRALTTW